MISRRALQSLTEDEREEFEERAAILEYDAGRPRQIAEAQAMRIVERKRNDRLRP